MLSPPSSKKLSSRPTRSTPQHLGKQPAQHRLRGRARRTVRPRRAHLRRRQRAAVELAVRRQRQTLQHHERRRHHVVRQRRRQRRTKLRHIQRGRPPPPPHSPPAAAPPPRHPSRTRHHRRRATPACRSSTASISPGSIRNPRSFTCASARPKNSSTPSGRHRARSPVRYIREPGTPCGSATNRSAVSPERFR